MSGSGMSRNQRFAMMVDVLGEDGREQERREGIRDAWKRINIVGLLQEQKDKEQRILKEKQDQEQKRLQKKQAEEQTRKAIEKFNEVAKKWKGNDLIKSYNDAVASKQRPIVDLKHPAPVTTSTTSMTAAIASAAVIPSANEVPVVGLDNAVPPAALTTPMGAPSAGTGTLTIPSNLKLPEPSSGPATPTVSASSSPVPSKRSQFYFGPDSPNAKDPHLFPSVPLPVPKQGTNTHEYREAVVDGSLGLWVSIGANPSSSAAESGQRVSRCWSLCRRS